MKDKPITGTLEFTKTDVSTGEPLPNTLIEIYNEKMNLFLVVEQTKMVKLLFQKLDMENTIF